MESPKGRRPVQQAGVVRKSASGVATGLKTPPRGVQRPVAGFMTPTRRGLSKQKLALLGVIALSVMLLGAGVLVGFGGSSHKDVTPTVNAVAGGAPAPSGPTPQGMPAANFSLADFRQSLAWCSATSSELKRLNKQNGVLYDDRRQQVEKELQRLVGRNLRWQVPIVAVHGGSTVELVSEWLGLRCTFTTRSKGADFDTSLLFIGDDISRNKAATLSQGMPVTIQGRVKSVRLDDMYHFVDLHLDGVHALE